jgi:periplasmic divalent cation tolerance protein
MTRIIQVMTTVGSKEDADRIAAQLVSQRLAACVQVEGPVESTYWWEGKVETSQEWRCTAKTRADLVGRVQAAIRAVHPYQVPEILAVGVEHCLEEYGAWLEDVLAPNQAGASD